VRVEDADHRGERLGVQRRLHGLRLTREIVRLPVELIELHAKHPGPLVVLRGPRGLAALRGLRLERLLEASEEATQCILLLQDLHD